MSTVSAFVGREDDLKRVDALLMENSRVNIAAAVGMGGVGKTELALQYAQRRGDAFAGGVCWLRGVEPIAPQMISFAQECLGLTVPEQVERPVAWCVQRWPGEGAVLMVVDDVQDYAALKEMLPGASAGDRRFWVLLTTREAVLAEGQRLALEVLVPGAALELLVSLVGEGRIAAELNAAAELCEWVGRLPLGIELVGWHLARRPELTVAVLLERLEGKRLAARALMTAHPEMTAKLGVAAAFEVSWEPLTAEGKTLAGLLGLFAAAPIDWAWVQRACELAGESGLDEEDLEEAQAELLRVNLLQVAKGARRYRVHPLVREFFAVKLESLAAAEDLRRGFAEVMTAVAKDIPQTATVAVRTQVAEAVPHMEEVALRWSSVLEGIDKLWCCGGLARFYESLSQWDEAERCYQRSLEISKAELGDRHPNTASSLNNLAALYKAQGRYGDAEPLLVQALEIRKVELGDRHPNTATSLNNLAMLYYSTQRLPQAAQTMANVVSILEDLLGPNHPNTLTVEGNLAAIQQAINASSDIESVE